MLAAVRLAADGGHDAHTAHLAWALDTFLDRRGHWPEQVDAWQAALPAVARLASSPAQATTHRLLARALTMLGRHDDAHAHFEQALDLYEQTGDATTAGVPSPGTASATPTTTSPTTPGPSIVIAEHSPCSAGR
jgi:tetratricopeptide (TPR) repeat protein